MNDILMSLIKGESISTSAIENELYEMCDREHSSCSDSCFVYALNNHAPVNGHRPFEENRGCDCFKSGKKMLEFIKKNLTKV